MSNLLQDLRYALRQMRRAPGFAFSVVFVLALGIGANAAMFTILEGTLFRPLPYARPGELVLLNTTTPRDQPTGLKIADLNAWRERSRTLSQIAYFDTAPGFLNTQVDQRGTVQRITSVQASANLCDPWRVSRLGSLFSLEEQQPGRGNVVVLSDAVWRSQFHADPHILGQVVRLDNDVDTVIGVMPRGFAFPAGEPSAQVWRPIALTPSILQREVDTPGYQIVGRLKPGESIASVDAELNPIQQQLLKLYTGRFAVFIAPAHVHTVGYRRSLHQANQRIALFALLGAVAALWLIACANVACLMLARTAARRREMAVRSALGAGSWRLIRQSLAESLLLSLTGAAVGLFFAQVTLQLFRRTLTTQFSPELALHPDARVLFALLLLSLFSAVLLGFVPARLASTVAVDQALRQDGAASGTGRHQQRLQRVLVVSELALTLTLLVSCGLLLRTVFALRKVPLGFRTDHVFVIDPKLPAYKYDKLDANAIVYKPLLQHLQAIPGVQSVALTTMAPLRHNLSMTLSLTLGKGESQTIVATMHATGPELQQVLGFGMARGRYFNAQDTPNTPLVAVVNKAFANLYEPLEGDVSKFSLSMESRNGPTRDIKIVGVVDDLRQIGLDRIAMPEIDLNAAQMGPTDGFYGPTLQAHAELLVRSTRAPADLIPELQHVMQQFNPDLNGTEISTMDQVVEDSMGSQLLAAHLLEALGGLALVVALAGLYSLLAYLVTLRTRELGLRLALGAQRSDILSLVLGSAGMLLAVGTASGIGISLLSAHLLRGFLFGVTMYDATTLVIASVLLLAVGTLAAWLPARRASTLEPMQALRTE